MVARLSGRGLLRSVDTGHDITSSGDPKGFFESYPEI